MRTIIAEQEASLRFPMSQSQQISERAQTLQAFDSSLDNLEQENRNIATK